MDFDTYLVKVGASVGDGAGFINHHFNLPTSYSAFFFQTSPPSVIITSLLVNILSPPFASTFSNLPAQLATAAIPCRALASKQLARELQPAHRKTLSDPTWA